MRLGLFKRVSLLIGATCLMASPGVYADPRGGTYIRGKPNTVLMPYELYGNPVGGSVDGVVSGVTLSGINYNGMYPEIDPITLDGVDGIDGYVGKNFDAVGTLFSVGDTLPRVTAGADYPDTRGISHAVTFDATHVYFSPALNTSDTTNLSVGQHILTNIVGINRTDDNPDGKRIPLNTWAGIITGVDPLGRYVSVSGWRVLGAQMGAGPYIPGEDITPPNSTPVAANTLDPTFKATHPAVYMGVFTRPIAQRIACSFSDLSGSSVVRTCDGIQIADTDQADDYTRSFHGLSIVHNGNALSTDSYAAYLGGAFPSLLKLAGGPTTVALDGNSIWVGGPQGDTTGTTGAVREMGELAQYLDNTDQLRLVTYTTRNVALSNTTKGAPTTELDLGYVLGGAPGTAPGTSGSHVVSHLVFNPAGYPGGVGICGQNACGIMIDSTGHVTFPVGMSENTHYVDLTPYLKITDARATYATQDQLAGYTPTKTLSTTYLTQADAANLYLSASTAASTYAPLRDLAGYLKATDATTTYLSQVSAAKIYETQSDVLNYLKKADAATTYLALADVDTTFKSEVTTNNILNRPTADARYALKTDIGTYLTETDAKKTFATKTDLAGYVSVTDAATNFAQKSDLTGYLTAASAAQTYVTNTVLANYTSTKDLETTYATKADLVGYVSSDDLGTTFLKVADAAKIYETQADAVTRPTTDAMNAAITTALKPYLLSADAAKTYATPDAVNTAVTKALAGYETTAYLSKNYLTQANAAATYALKTDVSGFLTKSDADTRYQRSSGMTDYVTRENLTSTLSGYETTADLTKNYQTVAGMSTYTTTTAMYSAISSSVSSALTDYLRTADAAATYETQADVSANYQPITEMSAYLKTSNLPTAIAPTLAGYLTSSNAATMYLTRIAAAKIYAPITGRIRSDGSTDAYAYQSDLRSAITAFSNTLMETNGLFNAGNGMDLGNGDIVVSSRRDLTITHTGTVTFKSTRGVLLPQVVHAALPASPVVGETLYCTDCYSVLRDGTSSDVGIDVHYNSSSHWVDAIGNVAQVKAASK